MKVIKLDENEQGLRKVSSDIETINQNKSQFFYDALFGEIDKKEVESFEKVKSWKPIYSIEDSCSYASELAYILTENKEYALISHYNSGGSALDHTKIIIAKDKEELKEAFGKLFAFNGLDSITDKRVAPRFDFDSLVDSFPDFETKKKPKLR